MSNRELQGNKHPAGGWTTVWAFDCVRFIPSVNVCSLTQDVQKVHLCSGNLPHSDCINEETMVVLAENNHCYPFLCPKVTPLDAFQSETEFVCRIKPRGRFKTNHLDLIDAWQEVGLTRRIQREVELWRLLACTYASITFVVRSGGGGCGQMNGQLW